MFSSSNGVYYVLIYLSIYVCVWISVHCSLTNFRIKMVAWNDCLHSVFVSDKRLKTLVFGQKLCEITTISQKRLQSIVAPHSLAPPLFEFLCTLLHKPFYKSTLTVWGTSKGQKGEHKGKQWNLDNQPIPLLILMLLWCVQLILRLQLLQML